MLKYNLDIRRDGLRPMLKIAAELERSKKTDEFTVDATNLSDIDVEEEESCSSTNYFRRSSLKVDSGSNAKREPKMTATVMEIATGNGMVQNLKIESKLCYGVWSVIFIVLTITITF